jgi:hypothetical protein
MLVLFFSKADGFGVNKTNDITLPNLPTYILKTQSVPNAHKDYRLLLMVI